jgi:hypothetical protein
MINKFNDLLKEVLIETQQETINNQKKVINDNKLLLDIDKKIKSFSVAVDDVDKANNILDLAHDLGLSIQKMKNKRVNTDGSTLLGFFFDDVYDVTYIQDTEEGLLLNVKPILNVTYDYYEIRNRLRRAAAEKKELTLNKGDKYKTYRTLYLEKASITQRIENGFKDINKKLKTKKEDIVVEVYDHFIQVGSKIIPKNPNDNIKNIKIIV